MLNNRLYAFVLRTQWETYNRFWFIGINESMSVKVCMVLVQIWEEKPMRRAARDVGGSDTKSMQRKWHPKNTFLWRVSWSLMANTVLEKTGTYFQIMDDFLNFFKTSLFWSPIRGCSLKQRLTEKKHSCSNTFNVAVQKNLPQKWHNGIHEKTQTIIATQQSKRAVIQRVCGRTHFPQL